MLLGLRTGKTSSENHLHESFLALGNLPAESKQSFYNFMKEQQYISQIEDNDFEILESEETKDEANIQEAPDQNF